MKTTCSCKSSEEIGFIPIMDDEDWWFVCSDGVATVTLNRPKVHNAFGDVVIRKLHDAFDEVNANATAKVMVLKASGKNFCAGADLTWMKRAGGYTAEQNRADALALSNLLHRLHTLRQPTLAVVQGAAMGGGVGLIAACDIAIGDTSAKFALSEVKLGLLPATISPYVMQAIGARQCHKLFLTGELFRAHEALRIGLLHELVDDLDEAEKTIVSRLLANAPGAMAESKQLIDSLVGEPIGPALFEKTANRLASRRSTDECKEGLSAFLEKRSPAWTN